MKALLGSPRKLYRAVAFLEVVTWTMLLTGMFLKYVTKTTDIGIAVAGPIHGFAFLAYCLVTTLVAVDQRWRVGRWIVGLLSAVPPFVTIPFEMSIEKHGLVTDAWRLRSEEPQGALERVTAFPVRRPGLGIVVAAVLLVVVFTVLLLLGPPGGDH
ncbi:DUF3817 domain-containing protein [Nocardioides sp. Y6]|uniref:DUF3817 domain-containing protein n=1 Tax=Nocardioides malaquae TaxID=2773426 RepID=A0ABR9RWV8_9ACTN|nr:DUF3817 domain-containing protein [Nocardioides malaquae]MBE7325850.1 DUF3817 domain-containing protein [Nocardioides malaquae]